MNAKAGKHAHCTGVGYSKVALSWEPRDEATSKRGIHLLDCSTVSLSELRELLKAAHHLQKDAIQLLADLLHCTCTFCIVLNNAHLEIITTNP